MSAQFREGVRAASERARGLGHFVRDVVDGRYHLDQLTAQSELEAIRDDMIMADLDMIQIKQHVKRSSHEMDVSERVGTHVPTYLRAAWHYELCGDMPQYQHAVERLNECFSFILSRELISGDNQQRDEFIRDFCANLGLDETRHDYLRDRLSVILMVRMRIRRQPPPSLE